MKIAIVHEMLIKLGGAERVLQEFMSMYPDADVFTLMYDEKKVGNVFPKERTRCTGPAQWFFRLTKKPRASLPLMPFSIGMLDFSDYDLVISSSSGFAHGAKTKKGSKMYNEKCTMYDDGSFIKNSEKFPPDKGGENKEGNMGGSAVHICYCHSPARYLWDWSENIQKELGVKGARGNFLKTHIIGPMVKLLFWWLRKVDLKASKRPDLYIANSEEVQKRIRKYYNRDSVVLWPSVDTARFSETHPLTRHACGHISPAREGELAHAPLRKGGRGDFPVSQRNHYIITSALTPFKRLDIPVRVLSKLNIPLKIIGGGDQRTELEKLAGPSVEFLGRLSDEEVAEAYKSARAFLMPQKEDAGIAPIEAMAAGLPVFGQGAGGLLEINIDSVTGRFFPEENDESFETEFLKFHQEVSEGKYDNAETIIQHAKKFDTQVFCEKFQKIVASAVSRFDNK